MSTVIVDAIFVTAAIFVIGVTYAQLGNYLQRRHDASVSFFFCSSFPVY